MVNALTGELIKQISLDIPGVDNQGDVLSGSPAVLDANGNGYVDRLYVGDNQGYLYRVNIPDTDPSTLQEDPADFIQTCELAKVAEPIYASPAVYSMDTYDSSGNVTNYDVKVMFGTGNNPDFYEDPNIADTTYQFYVFDDTLPPLTLQQQTNGAWALLTTDSDGTLCSCSSLLTPTWTYTLPAGQRIWASAFAAANTVYFGTSGSITEDPCDPAANGTFGNVYAVSLSNLTASSTPTTVASNVGNVTGLMVEDQHLYVKATNPTGGTQVVAYGGNTYNNPVAIGQTFDTQKILGSWRQIFQ